MQFLKNLIAKLKSLVKKEPAFVETLEAQAYFIDEKGEIYYI